jgi:short-subunit dehydrogenase
MNNFAHQNIWITGASSGIGESTAYAFAEKGAFLVLSARNMEALSQVQQNCLQKGAAGVEIVRLDLAEHDQLFIIAKQVLDKVQRIDILINNAGISQRSLAKDTQFEVDKFVINVNLLGTIALTKAVLPYMLAQKSGQIVVISSLTGKFATPLRSAYAAAKHGLHGFFDALRAEVYAENIKVLMVCPGFINTNVSINAVVGDGSKQGTMDIATAKGLSPSVVAQKIIKAITQNKAEIYVGGWELRAIYISRFFPRLFAKLIRSVKVT